MTVGAPAGNRCLAFHLFPGHDSQVFHAFPNSLRTVASHIFKNLPNSGLYLLFLAFVRLSYSTHKITNTLGDMHTVSGYPAHYSLIILHQKVHRTNRHKSGTISHGFSSRFLQIIPREFESWVRRSRSLLFVTIMEPRVTSWTPFLLSATLWS